MELFVARECSIFFWYGWTSNINFLSSDFFDNQKFADLISRYAITKAFCIAFLMTFFSLFDVPVFWPILLCYWIVLFVLTMKRQIMHMIKYKYVPFNIGKQVRHSLWHISGFWSDIPLPVMMNSTWHWDFSSSLIPSTDKPHHNSFYLLLQRYGGKKSSASRLRDWSQSPFQDAETELCLGFWSARYSASS